LIDDEEVAWPGAPSFQPSQRNVGALDDGPQEGDPLDPSVEEVPEPAGLLTYDEDADSDNEREFMAIKPWLGALYPPRKYRQEPDNPKNLKTVFTEKNNNWALPEAKIELDYVFGYRTRSCRCNAHWINEDRVVFFAGALCIIYKLKEDDQDFYFGHDDDVVCLDYHEKSGLCASGSIGARNTVRLCIWDAATQKTKHTITGFHMFAVVSVWFNPSGTIVASLGMDEHHSVALHCVETGQLLACSQVDKNRVLQVKWNTSSDCPDSESCFVTCGVKHICFWTPAEDIVKGGKYYFVAPQEVDKRLTWYRGTKCTAIDKVTFQCLESTPKLTLAGANNGSVYAFSSTSYACVFTLVLGKTPVQAMVPLADEGRTVGVGTKDGFVRLYDVHDEEATPSKLVTTAGGGTVININLLDEATDNDSDVLVNSVRSLNWQPSTKRLLVGTILSHLYAVNLALTTGEKPSARTLVGAHWGMLAKPDGYGEIWGVDAHPTLQHVYTTSMDGTVREWDLIDNRELKRMHLKYAGMAVSASADGKMVAVGHLNGSFTVVNSSLSAVVWPNTRHRVRRVTDVQFSPNSRLLAVASEMVIDVYAVRDGDPLDTSLGLNFAETSHAKLHDLDKRVGRVFERTGTCRGHTSSLRHLDWNLASTVIQSTSSGCELLYFSAPDCRRVTGAKHLADQQWWSQTCEFGWGVQGIWPRFADASDINSCGVSHSGRLLATTNDSGEAIVYNYPCVGSGMDKHGHMETRPQGHVLRGHCSHVTNCVWSPRDEYLITVGGADLCIFVWKITYANPPKAFVDAELVRTLQAQLDQAMKNKSMKASASPLATGVFPRDVLTADDPEERLRLLQKRISQKQRPDGPPPECSMCEYEFEDETTTTCPRCLMPRKVQRGAEDPDDPRIVKAPKTKLAPKKGFTDGFQAQDEESNLKPSATFSATNSHVMRPTASFAAQAKAGRQTKNALDAKPATPCFRATVRGGIPKAAQGKATSRVDIESDDSDFDDRLIKEALARSKIATGAPPKKLAGSADEAAKKKKKKGGGKVHAGPDFRDV